MKKRILAIVGLGLVWGVFFIIGTHRLDPDFGFHYRWGHDLLRKGWVWYDQYSYTFSDWPEVRHDWLTNVWMAIGYDAGGMELLAAVFAAVATAAIWIAVRGRKIETALVPVILTLATWFPRAGVRPQVQDWLLTIVLLRWMESGKKIKWIPLLFVVWVNLHGGFVMGLILLGTWVAGKCWDERKIWWGGVIIWLAALGTSVANPYGVRVWEEVMLTLTDSHIRTEIMEWLPFFYSAELAWWMLAGMLVAMGGYFRKTVPLWKLITVSGLLTAALGSNRNTAIFAAAGLVFLPELMDKFWTEVAITKEQQNRTAKIWGILAGFSVAVFLIVMAVGWPKKWNKVLGEGMYPIEAVGYLKTHPFEGNLFSSYNWGGYLIWKYPEKKLFIDGRMPSWRRKINGTQWPFKDFLKIVKSGDLEPLNKYDVQVILWAKMPGEEKDGWAGRLERWLKSRGLEVEKGKDFTRDIEKAGWKKIYEDNASVIYRRT